MQRVWTQRLCDSYVWIKADHTTQLDDTGRVCHAQKRCTAEAAARQMGVVCMLACSKQGQAVISCSLVLQWQYDASSMRVVYRRELDGRGWTITGPVLALLLHARIGCSLAGWLRHPTKQSKEKQSAFFFLRSFFFAAFSSLCFFFLVDLSLCFFFFGSLSLSSDSLSLRTQARQTRKRTTLFRRRRCCASIERVQLRERTCRRSVCEGFNICTVAHLFLLFLRRRFFFSASLSSLSESDVLEEDGAAARDGLATFGS
jgi:hypothetical protein